MTEPSFERPDLVLDVGIRGALNTIDAAKNMALKNISYLLFKVYQQPTMIPTMKNE